MRVIENPPGIWVKIEEINVKIMNRYKIILGKIHLIHPFVKWLLRGEKHWIIFFFTPVSP